MTLWTTPTRTKHVWKAPPTQEQSGVAYEFLIGDSHKLSIGDGFNLTIQPATVSIQWTKSNKSTSHVWPAPETTNENYLDIGDGYDLLIGNGKKLYIGSGRADTSWSTVTKTPL